MASTSSPLRTSPGRARTIFHSVAAVLTAAALMGATASAQAAPSAGELPSTDLQVEYQDKDVVLLDEASSDNFEELSNAERTKAAEEFDGKDIISWTGSEVTATPADQMTDPRATLSGITATASTNTCYHRDQNYKRYNSVTGTTLIYRVYFRHHFCSNNSTGKVYSTWTSGEGGQGYAGWYDIGRYKHQHATASGKSYAVYGRNFRLGLDNSWGSVTRAFCGQSTGWGKGNYSRSINNCSLYG